ncbi:MAG: hypothetical protein HZB16_10350 [Armatimonadetes bacterium]|nr:hypothetical protein [Armatimonadota bacterium]
MVRDFGYTAPLLGPWTLVPTRTPRATLALALRNNRDSGLGLALPAGTLRAFERDAQHRLHYVDAGELKMLSPEERADLTRGTGFDLRVACRWWGVNRAGNGRWRATIEMTVTSTRATDTVVRLAQPFDAGDVGWEAGTGG